MQAYWKVAAPIYSRSYFGVSPSGSNATHFLMKVEVSHCKSLMQAALRSDKFYYYFPLTIYNELPVRRKYQKICPQYFLREYPDALQ